MRYFLQLVEAVVNERIHDAVKLDTFIRMLEKVEDGDLTAINILGVDKANTKWYILRKFEELHVSLFQLDDEQDEEKIVKKQLRQLFVDVYQVAEAEAHKIGEELSKDAVSLLRMLAAKYRAGLHPHLRLIAQYIGQGLLSTEVQLEGESQRQGLTALFTQIIVSAAMIYLSRLDTAEVNLAELEQYCAIKCNRTETKPEEDDEYEP